MTYRMYSLEVRVDLKDERKHKAAEEVMRHYAEKVWAAFGLLQDHQKVHVTLYAHDHQRGHQDIVLKLTAADMIKRAKDQDPESMAMAQELAEALEDK